jgi:hypothetical protein
MINVGEDCELDQDRMPAFDSLILHGTHNFRLAHFSTSSSTGPAGRKDSQVFTIRVQGRDKTLQLRCVTKSVLVLIHDTYLLLHHTPN